MYEYLWMQRPILALVHMNPQMANLLMQERHCVVQAGGTDSATALASTLQALALQWKLSGLPDLACKNSYTTRACLNQLLSWSWLDPESCNEPFFPKANP
jgi:hypothetical protein